MQHQQGVIENCKIEDLITMAKDDLERIKAEEQIVEQK
jgi:hypothetical protein